MSGTAVNIAGRIELKGNWANHIKIYKNHSIVTNGVYSYVRHPLYSSIIFMLYGGSLIYFNWFSAVLVTFIFIPAMIYRARQEEQLLIKEFPVYEEYKRQVGLFFPKRIRGYGNERVQSGHNI
jgi:protein-S-isoprenylcysteine O-methyltransferase Ste14